MEKYNVKSDENKILTLYEKTNFVLFFECKKFGKFGFSNLRKKIFKNEKNRI